jgi:ATP adenylyltransferase
MKKIWAPWRAKYIGMEKPKGCIFCDKPLEDRDAENYIIFRGKLNFIIMNSYPYNPGHLMVVPYRHIGNVEDMTAEERIEHYEMVSRAVQTLKRALNTSNYNLGMNLGRAAGAGIDDHIHTHIVPRWNGDNNFMPVIADVRVIPEALADTYNKLKGQFWASSTVFWGFFRRTARRQAISMPIATTQKARK